MTRTATLTVATVCLAATTACAVRDDAPAVDTAAATGISPTDTGAQIVIPGPLPVATDSPDVRGKSPSDMPPVAGETSKRPADGRLERDSVSEPIFEVGPDGKVRPIKR